LISLTYGQVQSLNQNIQAGHLHTQDGKVQQKLVDGALQVEGTSMFYPVHDDIFYLLPDCVLQSNADLDMNHTDHAAKKNVKNFYDDFGWQEVDGVFQDAIDSEDLRDVSKDYITQCHLRLNQFLPKKGQFLLDIASGPIQYPAYLTYSKDYEYRICADISIQALIAAKKKLGDKGRYLLCDVTNLPIKENMIDAQVSLHTLYHVPKEEQAKAFAELYRVLKPGGTSVIVYSWGSRSLLMNVFLLPFKAYSYLKRKVATQNVQSLYFYAHSYQWFCQEIQAKYQTKLYSWRSVNVPFLKVFIHQKFGGKLLLKFIYWLEEHCPYLMGRFGAYPLFVSKK
jgi:ubiquinone/menaquinone biosynthesis C-methylase UbiE